MSEAPAKPCTYEKSGSGELDGDKVNDMARILGEIVFVELPVVVTIHE